LSALARIMTDLLCNLSIYSYRSSIFLTVNCQLTLLFIQLQFHIWIGGGNIMSSKLGNKINELRELHQIGVRELGRLVDVSAMHISNIEKGKSSASAEIIQKIAKALSADADELLALADQVAPDVANVINKNSQAVPSFLRAAKDLSPEQWEKLMKQVEKMKGK